ncbi:MAG: inosine/xanthosine triphosphatase [Xanthomonadales bacterium]|nr:inosine/xanthosine triphosphatase [Gammaproteobacteria bacterium]NND57624.1 inosine/xanthosine triphosphatase [Xanthomonadales bacterium]NNK52716.1 inosine/xanthosine triphosphatase [Xanthomonadales bacterium]
MKIVVASHNPVKIRAAEQAFALQFPGLPHDVMPASVASGVSDQPRSDDETRNGARNRALNACESMPGADYWVGLEGGIDSIDGDLMAFAWMAVLGPDGRIGEARTVTLPLPRAVKRLVDQGMELGDANDRVFATVNSKHQGGAFGLLTNGLYTREGVYTEALVVALVPFVSDLY